jgi:hypothetical protein
MRVMIRCITIFSCVRNVKESPVSYTEVQSLICGRYIERIVNHVAYSTVWWGNKSIFILVSCTMH